VVIHLRIYPHNTVTFMYLPLSAPHPDPRDFVSMPSPDQTTPAERDNIWQQFLGNSVEGLVGLTAVRADNLPNGPIINLRYHFLNHIALRDTFRAKPDQLHDIRGRLLTDFFPSIRDTSLWQTYLTVIETGQPQRVEQHYNVDQRDIWVVQAVAPFGTDGVMLSYSETSDLHRAARRLSQQTNLLNGVLNSSPNGVIVFEAVRTGQGQLSGFQITLVNQFFATIAGQDRAYFDGLTLQDIYPIGSQRMDRLQQLLDTGEPIEFDEFIPAFDRWLAVTLTRLNDGFVATLRDITAEKRTQEQLQDTVQELRRSNQDLEQFAYVASHDLQEPLRKIISFGDVLMVQYAPQLSESAANVIGRMQRSADRMRLLVQDLLTYARLSGHRDTFGGVELDQLLRSVSDDLDLTIQERNATLVFDPLPTVWGDATLLRQLFQNLIGNGIKFQPDARPDGTSPRITVRGRLAAEHELPEALLTSEMFRLGRQYVRIEVIDNGIGFDEQYLDRIFTIFQRLHGRMQFTGTGMGLAICKKVMDLHQGSITASSQAGNGATFVLYLPAP